MLAHFTRETIERILYITILIGTPFTISNILKISLTSQLRKDQNIYESRSPKSEIKDELYSLCAFYKQIL